MLYHTDIAYSADGLDELYSGLAVKIHGAVMRLIPTEFAAELHQNSLQPFSMFCMETPDKSLAMVRLSALTDDANLISRALEQHKEIVVYGLRKPLTQINCQHSEELSAEALYYSEVPNGYRISFITPAIFRRSGKSHCSPDISRYLISVIEKMNKFEDYSINQDMLLDYVSAIPLDSYSLNGQRYNVSGSVYNGMTGWADIVFPNKTSDNARLLNAVLRYAEYSGVGAKTAVGMGGISIEPF